jgi:hypothetical protein
MLDSAEEAAAFLAKGGCRLVYVEDRFAQAFATANAGIPPRPVDRVTGFNINGGKPVALSAYAVTP